MKRSLRDFCGKNFPEPEDIGFFFLRGFLLPNDDPPEKIPFELLEDFRAELDLRAFFKIHLRGLFLLNIHMTV